MDEEKNIELTQNTDTVYNSFGEVYDTKKPPKNKKGLIIGASIAAVFVVATVVIVLIFAFRKTPEEIIKLAVKNTFDEINDKEFSLYNSELGFSDDVLENPDLNFVGIVKNLNGEEAYEGLAVTADVAAEKTGDGYNYSFLSAAKKNGAELNVNAYQLDDVLYLDMPQLFDVIYSFDPKKLSEGQNSYTKEEQEEIRKMYDEYMTPAKEKLHASILYEYIGKENIENANGDRVKGRHYTITLPVKAFKEYIASFGSFINEYVSVYMSDYIENDLNMTQEQFMQTMNLVQAYFVGMFSSDFKINVYVSDDKLARVEAQYKLLMVGTTMSLTLDFMGDDYVMRDVAGNLLFVGDEAAINLKFSCRQENSKDEYKVLTNADVYVDEKSYAYYEGTSEYIPSTGKVTGNIKAGVTGESEIYTDFEGAISNIVKGKSYDMIIDSFRIYDEDSEYMSLEGTISVGDLGKEVSKPDSENIISFSGDSSFDEHISEEEIEKIIDAWEGSRSQNSTPIERQAEEAPGSSSELEDTFAQTTEEICEAADIESCDNVLEYIADDTNYNVSEDLQITSDANLDYAAAQEDGSDVEYSITVHEPDGYERAYGDATMVSIYNDDSNVYYYVYTDTTIDEFCKELSVSLNGITDCKVLSQNRDVVKISDGRMIEYYVMKLNFGGEAVTDIYYFIPLEQDQFVLCNAELWDEDVDIKSTAEVVMDSNVVIVN